MSDNNSLFSSDRRYHLFTAVKYLTYALLSFNVYVFLSEELLAVQHTFSDGIAPAQIIQAFAATIDTTAWISREKGLVRLELVERVYSAGGLPLRSVETSLDAARFNF